MSAAERLAPDIEQFWNKLDQLDEGGTFSLSDMVGSQYQNIFMMLCGFAIENLNKATRTIPDGARVRIAQAV